jgi:hypothetical protein
VENSDCRLSLLLKLMGTALTNSDHTIVLGKSFVCNLQDVPEHQYVGVFCFMFVFEVHRMVTTAQDGVLV